MSDGLAALFARRLLIVTGKGGTGKTTLAAALGLLASRQGLDTVVIELGQTAALPHLLSADPGALQGDDGRHPLEVAPHLFILRISPEIALTEYLELQLHIRALVHRVIQHRGFRRLLDAAPGWRALITLGKLWHLQSQSEAGQPRWDVLIVDGPSTGHGLSFLAVPNVVLDAVKLGPLRRHTEGVQSLLRDPARTLVVPVTLPEELPVSETLELCAGLHELGLTLGPVIANAVEPAPDLVDPEAVLDSVGKIPHTGATLQLDAELLRACVEHQTRRAGLHQEFLEKLERELDSTIIALPHLAQSLDGPAGLACLADRLEVALDGWQLTP